MLNLTLSTLVGVTYIMHIFASAYYYITSEFAQSFFFLLDFLKDLIFYDIFPGPEIILGVFAARLIEAKPKKLSQMLDKGVALNFVWKIAQDMDSI